MTERIDPAVYVAEHAGTFGDTPAPYPAGGRDPRKQNPWFEHLPARFRLDKPQRLLDLEAERDRLREELNAVTGAAHSAIRANDTEGALEQRDREGNIPSVLRDIELHILGAEVEWLEDTIALFPEHQRNLRGLKAQQRQVIADAQLQLNQLSQALNHIDTQRWRVEDRLRDLRKTIERRLWPHPPTLREVIQTSIERPNGGKQTVVAGASVSVRELPPKGLTGTNRGKAAPKVEGRRRESLLTGTRQSRKG